MFETQNNILKKIFQQPLKFPEICVVVVDSLNLKGTTGLLSREAIKGTVHPKIKNTYYYSYVKCYLSV